MKHLTLSVVEMVPPPDGIRERPIDLPSGVLHLRVRFGNGRALDLYPRGENGVEVKATDGVLVVLPTASNEIVVSVYEPGAEVLVLDRNQTARIEQSPPRAAEQE